MNKYIAKYVYMLIFLLPLTLPLTAAQNTNLITENIICCVPQLQKCLQAILQIPEAKSLLNSIRKEGSIHIAMEDTGSCKKFGAYWDPDLRVICIDSSTSHNEGRVIGSLLFEIHNASVNSKINHLNELASQGKIDKAHYVESMEYLEYINSLNASKIAQKGIDMGIFPKSSQMYTFPNFKEHFRAQQMSGHSALFARNFDLCL